MGRIESAAKTLINNYMVLTYSPFWFSEENVFKKGFGEVARNILLNHKKLGDSVHGFIRHFEKKYGNSYPPSWMIFEVLNFGDTSKIYSFLKSPDAKKIADNFTTSPRMLKSWLRSLTVTRNLCAHHNRLWNRELTMFPENSLKLKKMAFRRGSMGEQVVIIVFFLKGIAPRSCWLESLDHLLKSMPFFDYSKRGLRDDWLEELKTQLIK